MTWGLFLVLGTAACLAVCAWPGKTATLGTLIALILLELYMARDAMPLSGGGETSSFAIVDFWPVETQIVHHPPLC